MGTLKQKKFILPQLQKPEVWSQELLVGHTPREESFLVSLSFPGAPSLRGSLPCVHLCVLSSSYKDTRHRINLV